ncbi:MAG: DegQ family serine endoprotease [Deltaproteobacteria bacterium]|nr:DegQ family serine endoprotease [Deltaproteobacteria bacterium]
MSTTVRYLVAAALGGAVALGGYNALNDNSTPTGPTPAPPATTAAAPATTPPPPPAPPSKESIQELRKTSSAFVAIAKAVQPAVVNINTVQVVKQRTGRRGRGPMMNPFEDLFGGGGGEGGGDDMLRRFFFDPFGGSDGQRDQRRQGLGSGMIVDSEKGYVLTNNHVVAEADEIKITLSDGRSFDAKVVGTDPQTDVGVLQIQNPAKDLPFVRLGNSDEVQVGDWAIAVGNPFGLSQTVTVGIISAKGRSNVNITDYEDFIQTDAAINPGNSGGPLLNIEGEVIGVNTAIFSRSGGYQGIGFSIPSNIARSVMESLITGKKIERGFLGLYLQDITEEIAKQFKLEGAEGALISEVMPNGPAEQAGLKTGDIVVEIDGKKVKDSHELRNHVAFSPVGKIVKLTVLRDGARQEISVTLAARPDEKVAKESSGVTEKLGIAVEGLSDQLRGKYRTEANEGVVITEIDPQGIGAQMGLREGDVLLEFNRKPVKDVAAFKAAIQQFNEREGLLLLVDRQGRRIYLALNF